MADARSREREALADLEKVRRRCSETNARLQASHDTTDQTLADIRATMSRWDTMKADFGKALDTAIRRIADSMDDPTVCPTGPPTGAMAHGTNAPSTLPDPTRTLFCEEESRPKMHTGIRSHEYRDSREALKIKVALLADLIRQAGGSAAVYTGAGVSTAAGIPDYASKAGSSVVATSMRFEGATPFSAGAAVDAEPTLTHRILTALHAAGHFDEWVQQNHDGLPQKAGYPQACINEIHGGWFDPSNPVVPMEGRLRSDLVRRLREVKDTTRLVLAMGTSLSGVAADQLVSGVARRTKEASRRREGAEEDGRAHTTACACAESRSSSLSSSSSPGAAVGAPKTKGEERTHEGAEGGAPPLGVVIINVQQTRLDGHAALRIFAPVDEVSRMLAAELGVAVDRAAGLKDTSTSTNRMMSSQPQHGTGVYSGLSYAENGKREACRDGSGQGAATTTLDLRCGQRVKLAHGNEPMAVPGTEGTVGQRTAQGHYAIEFADGVTRHLGLWMLDAACAGQLEMLPVVNVRAAGGSVIGA